MAQSGGLGASGLDAFAQRAGFGEFAQELGAAAPALGVRLGLLRPDGVLGGVGLAVRQVWHSHTTPGPSLPLSLGRAV